MDEERKKKEIEEKKARRRKQMQERLENSLGKANFEGGSEEDDIGKPGQVSSARLKFRLKTPKFRRLPTTMRSF